MHLIRILKANSIGNPVTTFRLNPFATNLWSHEVQSKPKKFCCKWSHNYGTFISFCQTCFKIFLILFTVCFSDLRRNSVDYYLFISFLPIIFFKNHILLSFVFMFLIKWSSTTVPFLKVIHVDVRCVNAVCVDWLEMKHSEARHRVCVVCTNWISLRPKLKRNRPIDLTKSNVSESVCEQLSRVRKILPGYDPEDIRVPMLLCIKCYPTTTTQKPFTTRGFLGWDLCASDIWWEEALIWIFWLFSWKLILLFWWKLIPQRMTKSNKSRTR